MTSMIRGTPGTRPCVLRTLVVAWIFLTGVSSCTSHGWAPISVDPETKDEQYESMIGAKARLFLEDGRTITLKVTSYRSPILHGKVEGSGRGRDEIAKIDVRDVKEVELQFTERPAYNSLQMFGVLILLGLVIGGIAATNG